MTDRERRNEMNRARYYHRRRHGLCVTCGGAVEIAGRARCNWCLYRNVCHQAECAERKVQRGADTA